MICFHPHSSRYREQVGKTADYVDLVFNAKYLFYALHVVLSYLFNTNDKALHQVKCDQSTLQYLKSMGVL